MPSTASRPFPEVPICSDSVLFLTSFSLFSIYKMPVAQKAQHPNPKKTRTKTRRLTAMSEHKISVGEDPKIQIEHIFDDRELKVNELVSLLISVFGGTDSLWPANQRWLLKKGDRIISHASVQRRWFIVNARYYQGWFVGGVCTDSDYQRQGFASILMQQMYEDLKNQELEFIVLNCGESKVHFYETLGYKRIADRAVYLRNGQQEIDDDPALALTLKASFDVEALSCEIFPFGFEF